jgi:hypothetical protein
MKKVLLLWYIRRRIKKKRKEKTSTNIGTYDQIVKQVGCGPQVSSNSRSKRGELANEQVQTTMSKEGKE